MPDQDPYSAADRTLFVLEALADHSRITDIVAASGLPKATVHRILQNLVRRGFARANERGEYVGGPRILSLSGRFLQRRDLAEQVHPVLRTLQQGTGWTAHLALLSGDEAVYVAKVEGAKPYHLASRVGMALGLHCTSIGKAILATMPDAEVRALVRRTGLASRTPNTLTDEQDLLRELSLVRRRGYALDHEENEAGVRAAGAAVFDHTGQVIGGVSAAGLVHPGDEGGADDERGELVVRAAEHISEELGARQP